mgnify:FL=1
MENNTTTTTAATDDNNNSNEEEEEEEVIVMTDDVVARDDHERDGENARAVKELNCDNERGRSMQTVEKYLQRQNWMDHDRGTRDHGCDDDNNRRSSSRARLVMRATADSSNGADRDQTVIDLTREEDCAVAVVEKAPELKAKVVHSFFQKRTKRSNGNNKNTVLENNARNATVNNGSNGAATTIKGVTNTTAKKYSFEAATRNLPPKHFNCPAPFLKGFHSSSFVDDDNSGSNAMGIMKTSHDNKDDDATVEKNENKSDFVWRFEIEEGEEEDFNKNNDDTEIVEEEQEEIEIEMEAEKSLTEEEETILKRLEMQFKKATIGTPWVEICKPNNASEAMSFFSPKNYNNNNNNTNPAELCRSWLSNWKARIESNKNTSKNTFRNEKRQRRGNNNNNQSDDSDSDAKWEREMGMELSDDDNSFNDDYNDGFGDGSGANIANGLIVFGDSGSGKTATIRAVADELGFSILEVNAGHNRSGRDILERFGESTQSKNLLNKKAGAGGKKNDHTNNENNNNNKLVASKKANIKKISEKKKKNTTTNNTLLSFVKKKTIAAPKEAAKEKEDNDRDETNKKRKKDDEENKAKNNDKNKNNNGSKNTIVVFEDVDCFFDEDEEKEFDRGLVPPIATLLEAAKRPIVVVCKNEDVLDRDNGQLRHLTSLGTSTTRVGFEKPSVERLAKYLHLCCLAKMKALTTTTIESSSSNQSLSMSQCLNIAKIRNGDIRGALNDCEIQSAFLYLSSATKINNAIGKNDVASDFLFDVALPLLNDSYSNGQLPIRAIEYTEEVARENGARENETVAKFVEASDIRFLEFSLKEQEKRDKAKDERRRKKLEALGLKESQVDPDIASWKDLEDDKPDLACEEIGANNNNNATAVSGEENSTKNEENDDDAVMKEEGAKCTPVRMETAEENGTKINTLEYFDNDNDDDDKHPQSSQQDLDIPPSPLTSTPKVALESSNIDWGKHVVRMTLVSTLTSIQTNFDVMMRPKPFGVNGIPLPLKSGVLARYNDCEDIDEDFLLTGKEPRKQLCDERKRISSQCADFAMKMLSEKIVPDVLHEGFDKELNFADRLHKHESKMQVVVDEQDILYRQRKHATLLNSKLETSSGISLATYIGFASKIAKARFQSTALDTPGKTRTRRAKVSFHLDKFVNVEAQVFLAQLSNFNQNSST